MNSILIALVPGLLALLPVVLVPRRRRSLSLLRAEVELLAAMPEGGGKSDIEMVVEEGAARYFDRYISREPADVRRRRMRWSFGAAYGSAVIAIGLKTLAPRAGDAWGWTEEAMRTGSYPLIVISVAAMAVFVVTFTVEVAKTKTVPNPLSLLFGLPVGQRKKH